MLRRFTAIHPVLKIRQQCIPSGIPGMMKFADGTRYFTFRLKNLLPVDENPKKK